MKQNGIPLIQQTDDETPKRGRRKKDSTSPAIPVPSPEPIPLGVAIFSQSSSPMPPSPPEPEVIAEIAPPLPPPFEQAPPPLPEKLYRLTDQSLLPESQVRTLPPTTLIWHPDFGQSWKQVGEIFP